MFVVRLVVFSIVAATAFAQGSPRKPSASGFATKAPKLTKADVEKLIKVIPELARESGKLKSNPAQSMNPMGGGGMQNLPIEDLQRIESLLKKHNYTFPDFLMQMTTLVLTYVALKPEEFEKQLPSEDNPEIRKILDDPKVSASEKEAVRKQIKEVHTNKEILRKKLTAMITEEHKRVVKPMLSRVQRALETAEAEARKARDKAKQD